MGNSSETLRTRPSYSETLTPSISNFSNSSKSSTKSISKKDAAIHFNKPIQDEVKPYETYEKRFRDQMQSFKERSLPLNRNETNFNGIYFDTVSNTKKNSQTDAVSNKK